MNRLDPRGLGRPRVLLILMAWVLAGMHLWAQDAAPPTLGVPEVLTSGGQEPILFVPVSVRGATKFAVECSEDLTHWKTLWNYSFRDVTNVFSIPDPSPATGAARFYRLRSPGDLVDDRQAEWTSQAILSCRFRYEPRIGFCNCIKSALVTVSQGVVTSVSDAVRATGFPEPNPNIADFPSIEQLFDMIRRCQSSRDYEWVRIVYDPILNYPVDVFLGGHPDSAKGFTLSELEILER